MVKSAVFTICKNEKRMLPVWLRYYSQYFDANDIYVLDHQSDDGSTTNIKANVIVVVNDKTFDHRWLNQTVGNHQRVLLQKYSTVLFAETDEMIIPNLKKYPGGLREYIDRFDKPVIRCIGWEIMQNLYEESELNWEQPIFEQRKFGFLSVGFNKPLLAKTPVTWGPGFHHTSDGEHAITIDNDLGLFHLRQVDLLHTVRRSEWKRKSNSCNDSCGHHQRWNTQEVLANYAWLHTLLRPLPYDFIDPKVL